MSKRQETHAQVCQDHVHLIVSEYSTRRASIPPGKSDHAHRSKIRMCAAAAPVRSPPALYLQGAAQWISAKLIN